MKFYAKYAAFAIAAATTACSGSPSTSGVPVGVATTAAQPSSAANATFTLTIPRSAASAARLRAAHRTRHYVSFGTRGLSLTVYPSGGNPANGTVINYDLSPSSNICPSDEDEGAGEQQCTITIPAPVGSDTFVANTYMTTPAQGFTGGLLSTGTTTATIVAGQINTVSMVLEEVVNSVVFGPPRGIVAANQAALVPVNIFAFDAAGDSQPAGDSTPYSTPVKITYAEFNNGNNQVNHTSFSVNNGFPVGFVTATKPSDLEAVRINYDGQAPLGYYATLYATVPSVSSAPIGSGLANPVFFIAHSPYYADNSTAINFTAVGQSVTITADLGDLGDPAYPVTVSSAATQGCNGIVSVTPLTSGSFPSTAVTALASGSCYVVIEFDQTFSFGVGGGGGGVGEPFNILVSIP